MAGPQRLTKPGTGKDKAWPGHGDVLGMALPMIAANLSVPLVGIADSTVMGHLADPGGLAAVAVGSTLFSVAFTALNFLRMGTTGLTSQAHGAGREGEVADCLRRGVRVAVILALVLMALLGFAAAPLAGLLAGEPMLAADAAHYVSIRLWGAPATLCLFVFTGWFIGLGRGRDALRVVVTVNLTNVLLDFLFVWGLGAGVGGVASASVIAEVIGLAVAAGLSRQYVPRAGGVSRDPWRDYLPLLRLNLPLFSRTVVLMLCFAFVTAAGSRLGSEVLAANALLMNFLFLASYVLDGFANAAESLVGRSIGAGDQAALQRSMALTARWTLAGSAALSLLFFALGPAALALMTSQVALRTVALEHLAWVACLPLVGGWAFLFDGFMVGATRARDMRDSMAWAALVVFLPAWWLLRDFGNHGLWAAFLLFFAARGAIQAWMLRHRPLQVVAEGHIG
ncbi:MAG: MATE family efflux transporter [Steroidobacteraceae bacterium]